MRFFKYLVLISASIISVDALAAAKYQVIAPPATFPVESSPDAACSAYASQMSVNDWKYSVRSATETRCYVTRSFNGGSASNYDAQIKKTLDCPAKGWPIPVYVPAGSKIPTRMCKDGCSIEGAGMRVGVNDTYDMTPMQFTGDDLNCTEQHSNDPPPCDTKDPYGKCYIPPNDNCTRLSDGSITCPPDQP
ncbi:hypothetical protein I6M93_18065, partial [Acinetobacter vivianii]|nr:hypothetical protein [Acinetobacter vivianii]